MTPSTVAAQGILWPAEQWFAHQGWQVFSFQQQAWEAYLAGRSGLINAPTGSGKTYAALMGPVLEFLAEDRPLLAPTKKTKAPKSSGAGLRLLWITPLRALAAEICQSSRRAIEGMGLNWQVELRTGDTSSSARARQQRRPPEMMITTPESLHLLLSRQGYPEFFKELRCVICDEWHELAGSKRGVLMELALSRLRAIRPALKTWGISATIGNLDEALLMLMGTGAPPDAYALVRAQLNKRYEVSTVFPDEVERFPWRGHLGLKLIHKVLPILHQSRTTLIFTNTRAQCEHWYQALLDADPMLAGVLAMHHGSLSREIRDWVEDNLHSGRLKAVVCTSSLDLGVDFRPVETVIQVGSPKGVARFMQRAGRAGHQPGAISRIYFLPTHALEIIEGAALRAAIAESRLESRPPYLRSADLLVQYLLTLAAGEGLQPEQIWEEIRTTYAYARLSPEDWQWHLNFIRTGGKCFDTRDEYRKVEVDEQGVWRMASKMLIRRHRMNVGAIVSDNMLPLAFQSGKPLGAVEENFIAQLKPGDTFWFAGRNLEFIRIKDMTVHVRKSDANKGKVPTWAGGRMPLSSELAAEIRQLIGLAALGDITPPEMEKVAPLLETQMERSHLPQTHELLLEYFEDAEGFHLLSYPFEGRFVHEGLGALLAYRLSKRLPISFTIAINDYGFELLSDQPIPVDEALADGLFSIANLQADIQASVNSVEMARRRFRDIASISGLVFRGFPDKPKPDRHLQANAQLFFSVFQDYEPDNLLLRQAFDEVLAFQLEENRLRAALERIAASKIVLARPRRATPFAFPLIVERLRERLSSEKLEDRIRRMKRKLEAD